MKSLTKRDGRPKYQPLKQCSYGYWRHRAALAWVREDRKTAEFCEAKAIEVYSEERKRRYPCTRFASGMLGAA